MRQAGRYLPEYRAVREKAGSFLDLCYNPELSSEVTMQPLRRFDLDAAIVFADILVVPNAMGLVLKFDEGSGPALETVRGMDDVNKLRPVSGSREVARVCETVAMTRSLLEPGQALIGFCGAPWTVASYIIGGGSSDRVLAKVAAYQRLPWFRALIDRLVMESIDYLSAQADAGAQVVQIFDSWAGDLVGQELEEFVVRPIGEIVDGVKSRHPGLPVIAFARGLGCRQVRISELAGVNAIGVETELALEDLPSKVIVQGNLDPVALLAGREVAVRETVRLCESISRDRHVFNLGHGIRVGTDPAVVGAVVDAVRRFDG
jgi:uroporphyrinogen decarboxylase